MIVTVLTPPTVLMARCGSRRTPSFEEVRMSIFAVIPDLMRGSFFVKFSVTLYVGTFSITVSAGLIDVTLPSNTTSDP